MNTDGDDNMKNIHILVQRWFADGEGWAYDIDIPETVRMQAATQINDLAGQFEGEILTKTVRIDDWYMYIRVEPDLNCLDRKAVPRHPHIDIGILSDEELDDATLSKLFQQAQAFEKHGAASNVNFADHNASTSFSWTPAVLLILLLCIGAATFFLWKNQGCSSQVSEKTANTGTNANSVSNAGNKNPNDVTVASDVTDALASNTVVSQIELWNQFEDDFKQLSSNLEKGNATVLDCREFLNKYDNADKFDGYDRYHTIINEVRKILTAVENNETVENLCKEFDKFESDYSSDGSQFKKTFLEAARLKVELNRYRSDPQIQSRLMILSDIENKNNKNWEDNEFEKFCLVEKLFQQFPSIENLEVIIKTAKEYLEDQDSPKLHKDDILKQLQAYEAFRFDLQNKNITITLNSYDVSGSGFNNWMFNNNLDFTFSLGGITQTIQLRGVRGSGDGFNRDVRIPLNNSRDLTIELVNIDWKHIGKESINLLEIIFSGKESFENTFSIRCANNDGIASVNVTISDLPTPPKPLVLVSAQAQKPESESEEGD